MGSSEKRKEYKKCKCDCPKWQGEEILLPTSGKIIYIMYCRNCKSRWKTERVQMRKYFDLSKRANYNGLLSFGEVFRVYDEYVKKVKMKQLPE